MNLNEIINLSLSLLTLMGIIFAIYIYFRKPQETGEINDAVYDEKMKNINEKFANLSSLVVNLRDNHLHSLDNKLEAHIRESQAKGGIPLL